MCLRLLVSLVSMIGALLWVAPVSAAQDPAAIRKAVQDYLSLQTSGIPGQVRITVGPIDARNQLPPCAALEVALPPGGRAWGRTNVVVRCSQPGNPWSQYISAQVQVKGEYLVAARALSAGHVLREGDMAPQQGDLTDLPGNIITDPRMALGRTLTLPTAAGRPLRSDLLRETLVVQAGQMVKIISRGPGFQVSSDGQVLSSAAAGQTVRVRAGNGQIVSGIARNDGTVEVSY